MSPEVLGNRSGLIKSAVLFTILAASGGGLVAWKAGAEREAAAAAASMPEPMESITAATAVDRQHRRTTTAVGTVLALRSITLRNELPGTVRFVRLTPGQVVDQGTVLVALDVDVEEADLKAQQAEVELARTTVERLRRLVQSQAVSEEEVDKAVAEYAVAQAQVERIRAIIARKIIRAPFRARVGIADVHPGQYLDGGTELTTLQGVSDAAHVDFSVAQDVAAGLKRGDQVSVYAGADSAPIAARIVAVDAKVDPTTRNATVRARVEDGAALAPGASVRVEVPVGRAGMVVIVPASALRKGPGGDHVFVIEADSTGQTRAHARPVRTGEALGDEVSILYGLAPGEQVATSGSFKLREGVLVVVGGPQPIAGSHP
ncbi:MAG TPA: efflux RND transporter periplasmic adaptor subunit [Gemmatimonadales bacterium]|nr:efflux RND transporter periplasmic adaptor subunit [Gemmatimonadales bacterium]